MTDTPYECQLSPLHDGEMRRSRTETGLPSGAMSEQRQMAEGGERTHHKASRQCLVSSMIEWKQCCPCQGDD